MKLTFKRWYLARLRRIVATCLRKALGMSDHRHWSSLQNHRSEWEARTLELSRYILPESRVIEFGAGSCALRSMLPSGCTYTSSDLIEREQGTIVIDLNSRPLPVLANSYDVAVFGGVLEYVNNVSEVLAWLHPMTARVICSYEDVEVFAGAFRKIQRRGSGWVNSYTQAELVTLFEENGYSITRIGAWDYGAGAELIIDAVAV